MAEYDSLINYENVLEYRPPKGTKKDFEGSVAPVAKDLVSQVYTPSPCLEQIKKFSPSNTLSILNETLDKIDETLNKLDKDLIAVTGDGISFSDYKKALVNGDVGTVSKFEDAHANSITGNPGAELYGGLFKTRQEVQDMKDVISLANYGTKDISLNKAKNTDNAMINKLTDLERQATIDAAQTKQSNISMGDKTFSPSTPEVFTNTNSDVNPSDDSIEAYKQKNINRDIALSNAVFPSDTPFTLDDVKVQNKQQEFRSTQKSVVSTPTPISNPNPKTNTDIDMPNILKNIFGKPSEDNQSSSQSSDNYGNDRAVGKNSTTQGNSVPSKNVNYSAIYFDAQINKAIGDKASSCYVYAMRVDSITSNKKPLPLNGRTKSNPSVEAVIKSNFSKLGTLSDKDKQKLDRIGDSHVKLILMKNAMKGRNEALNIMNSVKDLNTLDDVSLKFNLIKHMLDIMYDSKQAILDLHKMTKLEELYRSDYIGTVESKQNVRNFYSGYSS